MKIGLSKKSKFAIFASAALVVLILCASLAACDAAQQRQADVAIEPALERCGEDETNANSAPDAFDDVVDAEDVASAESMTSEDQAQCAAQPYSGNAIGPGPAVSESERATGQAPQASQAQAQTNHVHSWIPITEPCEVIDQQAWVETVYKTVECTICSVCGEDITNGDSQGRSITAHGKAHALAGEGGGCHSSTKKVPNGTVTHGAVTHWENKTTGYRCACGAERSA